MEALDRQAHLRGMPAARDATRTSGSVLGAIKRMLVGGLLGLEAGVLVALGALPIPQIPAHEINDVYLDDPLFDVCTRKIDEGAPQPLPLSSPGSMDSPERARDQHRRIMHFLYNPELSKSDDESVIRRSLTGDEWAAFRAAVDGSFCYAYPHDPKHVGVFAFNWPLSAMMALVLDLCDESATFACGNEMSKLDKALEKYSGPCVDPDTLVNLGCFTSDAFPPLNKEMNLQERYRSIHFFDDGAFIGRQLVRAYFIFSARGEPARAQRYLEQARRVHAFSLMGESRSSEVAPGGIRWMYQNWNSDWADRGTNTNAGVAQLAILLHLATGQAAYLEDGLRLYRWINAHLKDPATGLFKDRIIGTSTLGSVQVDPTLWSYNQGLMIGLNALLYRASGTEDFLLEAESIAWAAVGHYSPSVLDVQSPAYNRIYAENLYLLALETRDVQLKGAIHDSIHGYIERFGQTEANFDPRTGLVRLQGSPEQLL